MRKLLIVLAVGGGLLAARYGAGQNSQEPADLSTEVLEGSMLPYFSEFTDKQKSAQLAISAMSDGAEKDKAVAQLNKDKADSLLTLAKIESKRMLAFKGAGETARDSSTLAIKAVTKYQIDTINARSAAQASQLANEISLKLQAVQVVQNARIIELLGQIAAQKK